MTAGRPRGHGPAYRPGLNGPPTSRLSYLAACNALAWSSLGGRNSLWPPLMPYWRRICRVRTPCKCPQRISTGTGRTRRHWRQVLRPSVLAAGTAMLLRSGEPDLEVRAVVQSPTEDEVATRANPPLAAGAVHRAPRRSETVSGRVTQPPSRPMCLMGAGGTNPCSGPVLARRNRSARDVRKSAMGARLVPIRNGLATTIIRGAACTRPDHRPR
jgi:hypothetical protein